MLNVLKPNGAITKHIKNLLTVLGLSIAVSACQIWPTEPTSSKNTNQTIIAHKSGFGGTGKTGTENTKIAANSGFGGTGKTASNSGFGGTGIIGTITKFGSIWVNGIEVEYNNDVKVSSNVSAHETLQIGQQVIVETDIAKVRPWTENIYIFYPIAGQIETVSANQITVDGKLIYLNSQTQISKGIKLKVGNFVAINGYPDNNNHWLANRISHNPKALHIYQLAPDVSFSDQVHQLLIEITKPQLSALNNSFKGLPIAIIETRKKSESNQKYLLKAKIEKGEITQYDLLKYQSAINKLKQRFELNKIN
ncbi:DUF5666 domain-containing protein [Thiomicrorhabdus sp. Milos-T2]|uniref:DUF5666 domain-containing protein n=1 Tax=Thiomicrorhabdus sp. Milos-T2 TaxID=90814 RepID=UPI000493C4D0|nr:DUF5666 domain-containing protein [Thiomicrorhabdus sp. Milos-T2]